MPPPCSAKQLGREEEKAFQEKGELFIVPSERESEKMEKMQGKILLGKVLLSSKSEEFSPSVVSMKKGGRTTLKLESA